MFATPIQSIPAGSDSTQLTRFPLHTQAHTDAERVVAHFVQRDILRPESRATSYVLSILAAPPEALRVSRVARRVYASRRTLGRHFRCEGLPAPIDWVALARIVCAHRTILRGGPLRIAALAAGYPDQFTMSNAIHRITGIRPSQLRNLSWNALLDVWIARQRERGALTGPPASAPVVCPLCASTRRPEDAARGARTLCPSTSGTLAGPV
jgi:AraC-like DNA-binding protein